MIKANCNKTAKYKCKETSVKRQKERKKEAFSCGWLRIRDGTRNSTAADKPSFFLVPSPSPVPDYSRFQLCLLSENLSYHLSYQKQGQILLSFLRRQPEGG